MAIIKKTITGLKPDTNYLFTVKPKNTEIAATDDLPDSIRIRVPAYSGTPPKVSNLVLASNFQSAIFKFDPINDADLDYYEYQIFDIDPRINPSALPLDSILSLTGDSERVSGINKATVFVVSVENSTTTSTDETTFPTKYWGRVRAVNTARNASTDWSDVAESDETPLIDEQFIGSLTAAKITSGQISSQEITLNGQGSIIKSSASPGWYIEGDGEFSLGGSSGITYTQNAGVVIGSNVLVSADLEVSAGELLVTGPNPGEILRISNSLPGGNAGMVVGSGVTGATPNNHWFVDGDFRVGGSTDYILWNPQSSELSVKGEIDATTGNIGEWQITEQGLFNTSNETIAEAEPGENLFYRSSVEIYPPGFKEYVGDNVKSFSSIKQTSEWEWNPSFNPDLYSYVSNLSSDNIDFLYKGNTISADPDEFLYSNSSLSVDGLLIRSGDSEADIETALGQKGVFLEVGSLRYWGEPLQVLSEDTSALSISSGSTLDLTAVTTSTLSGQTVNISASGSGSAVNITASNSSITSPTTVINSSGTAFGTTTITSGSSRHTLINGGSNVSLSSNTGRLIISPSTVSTTHLAIDQNTIQAKATGTASAPLYLNDYGGIVYIGGNVNTDIYVTGDIVKVSTGTPMQAFSFQAGWSLANGGELGRYPASSVRYKENISFDIKNDLNPQKILDISVVQFNYKPGVIGKGDSLEGRTLIGLLAEDVHEKYPVACIYNEDGIPERFYELALIPAMLKVIQDLSKKVDDLESRLI
jgi:hypothetical protein